MALDPRLLVEQARPQPSPDASTFTPQPGAMRRMRDTLISTHDGRDVSVEQMNGADPRVYRDRIQPPPCAQCFQDHNPIATAKGQYDHDYLSPDNVDNPNKLVVLSAMPPAVEGTSAPPSAAGPPPKRVSVFPGRGDDDYVVVVEERVDDDWEDSYKRKLSGDLLARLLPVLVALDVKIKDRTGGDLVELRERKLD